VMMELFVQMLYLRRRVDRSAWGLRKLTDHIQTAGSNSAADITGVGKCSCRNA
jgi:hypothetical protein